MRSFLLAVIGVLPGIVVAADKSWPLASPDRQCVISVETSRDGELSYQVFRAGKPMLLKSPLGLRRQDEAFERGLQLRGAGPTETRHEIYDLFAGVTPHVEHTINYRSLVFCNAQGSPITIDLAAANEGVAVRYRFTGGSNEVRVVDSESTGFKVPPGTRGWLQPYHAAGPYTPAYEDFYFHVSPGMAPPKSRAEPRGWSFPALFELPQHRGWVLLTESGTDGSYCGCHLRANCANGLYRIAFAEPDEATKGQVDRTGSGPCSTLPWTMPWRVVVLGESAGAIATSTLVTDLAAPCRIRDTSWIRPGRASWAWWSYPDGPTTVGLFNQFTDVAARMHWEYTLFDAGWWKPGLHGISRYALDQHVAPLAWNFAGDFYDADNRARKLDQMQAAGVVGVKVDFWCSDRQNAIAAMHALLADAANRRIIVNFHGCTIPRGWQRTWPNLLTMEAVLGTECYFFEPRYTAKAAELDTVLPFTRNAIGPMDLTPIACSPKKYARTTTAAHQLAAALIFTSGIIHYADGPEFFQSLPEEARQVLSDAPARWDETRCLLGEPGRVAVFARRSGPSWFIAGINGAGEPSRVTLDLSPYTAFSNRVLLAEGASAEMSVAARALQSAAGFRHTMPPRGGFILRLTRSH